MLYGNDAFSILVLSTKKRYSSILKKVFISQKICFKVKILKTLKTFSDCHVKVCRPLKLRAIMKIPSIVFLEEPMPFLSALKLNLLELRQKPTQVLVVRNGATQDTF